MAWSQPPPWWVARDKDRELGYTHHWRGARRGLSPPGAHPPGLREKKKKDIVHANGVRLEGPARGHGRGYITQKEKKENKDIARGGLERKIRI